MSKVLVYLQINDGKLLKASLAAITAAKEIQSAWGASGLIGLVLGSGSQALASQCTGFGFEKVIFSEAAAFEKYIAPVYSKVVSDIMNANDCSYLVLAATSTGKDFSPRVAVRLSAGQGSDCVAVNSDGTLKRPMYAGNAFADVEILSEKRIVTIRPTSFIPASAQGATVASFSVEEATVDLTGVPVGEVLSIEGVKGSRPELADAEVVVSGGRALGSAENFEKVLFPLADSLTAAVGASRAAVDSGYAPNDWQVGQTGKVVAPQLYIAVGISGAIQHLAGMKDSKVIVAINKDPEAPIFEVADYGIVGDLFEIAPKLTEKISAVRKG